MNDITTVHFPLSPAVCLEGAVRLVGGSNSTEGRIEICLNRAWGTVCDDRWDNTDAGVACAQLGFSRYSMSLLISNTVTYTPNGVRYKD